MTLPGRLSCIKTFYEISTAANMTIKRMTTDITCLCLAVYSQDGEIKINPMKDVYFP